MELSPQTLTQIDVAVTITIAIENAVIAAALRKGIVGSKGCTRSELRTHLQPMIDNATRVYCAHETSGNG